MVRFKNFECTINVDGVALPEYTDPKDAGAREGAVPTAIVYIQSEEGKPFSINFSMVDGGGLWPDANALAWSAILDGNELKPGWLCKAPRGSGFINGNRYQDRKGNWFQRDFLFSKLDIREDGPVHKDNINTSSLGEIAIRIRRYKITGRTRLVNKKKKQEYDEVRAVTSLPEEQLKGRDVSHSVGLSKPAPARQVQFRPGHFVCEPKFPYAVIKFRYRTEGALKGLGLIPRTPLSSLSPESEAIEANTVPAEQMTVSSEQVTVPAEKKVVPTEKMAVPAEKRAVPAEKRAVPAEKKVVPAEKMAVPAEKVAVPAEKVAVPVEQMTGKGLLTGAHRLRISPPSKVKLEKTAGRKRKRSVSIGPSALEPMQRKKQKVSHHIRDSDLSPNC